MGFSNVLIWIVIVGSWSNQNVAYPITRDLDSSPQSSVSSDQSIFYTLDAHQPENGNEASFILPFTYHGVDDGGSVPPVPPDVELVQTDYNDVGNKKPKPLPSVPDDSENERLLAPYVEFVSNTYPTMTYHGFHHHYGSHRPPHHPKPVPPTWTIPPDVELIPQRPWRPTGLMPPPRPWYPTFIPFYRAENNQSTSSTRTPSQLSLEQQPRSVSDDPVELPTTERVLSSPKSECANNSEAPSSHQSEHENWKILGIPLRLYRTGEIKLFNGSDVENSHPQAFIVTPTKNGTYYIYGSVVPSGDTEDETLPLNEENHKYDLTDEKKIEQQSDTSNVESSQTSENEDEFTEDEIRLLATLFDDIVEKENGTENTGSTADTLYETTTTLNTDNERSTEATEASNTDSDYSWRLSERRSQNQQCFACDEMMSQDW